MNWTISPLVGQGLHIYGFTIDSVFVLFMLPLIWRGVGSGANTQSDASPLLMDSRRNLSSKLLISLFYLISLGR